MQKNIFVSIGCSCIVKEILNDLNITIPERLPFDWCGTDSSFVADSLSTNFRYWNPLMFYASSVHQGNNFYHIKNRRGQSGFIHDIKVDATDIADCSIYYDTDGYMGNLPLSKEKLNAFTQAYQRRINRFRDLANDPEVNLIFVWHDYRGAPIDNFERVWNSLNRFMTREFTLLCIEHTNVLYDNIPLNHLGMIKKNFYVCTYYSGLYNAFNAKPMLMNIILKYIATYL